MENNSGKKIKWKINIFDIIIIAAVIIAVVIFLVVMSPGGSNENQSRDTVLYSVEITNMVDGADRIKKGDRLLDSVRKYELGEVVSAEILPAVTSVLNYETGNFVESELIGRDTAIITISSPANISDTNITVGGGFVIKVGLQINVAGPGYAGSGYIVSVDREDGN